MQSKLGRSGGIELLGGASRGEVAGVYLLWQKQRLDKFAKRSTFTLHRFSSTSRRDCPAAFFYPWAVHSLIICSKKNTRWLVTVWRTCHNKPGGSGQAGGGTPMRSRPFFFSAKGGVRRRIHPTRILTPPPPPPRGPRGLDFSGPNI